MIQKVELTLEQQFEIAALNDAIREMETQDIKILIVDTYRKMLLLDNDYRQKIGVKWGLIKDNE